MLTDIEIVQNHKMEKIQDIAKKINVPDDYLELYGKYKAKISLDYFKDLQAKKDGKLVLVTAITPTKAGEGKTTTSIGIADALFKLGKNPVLCLREPSMGPVFGIKGGAAGGGYSQVVPMEDINLHFTGDMHAITSCNNLVSACIDNSIFQGNPLNIDPSRVVWKRCLDVNDRALREITVGQGNKNGVERKDGFNITVATEVMAILCLSRSLEDFREKISKCVIGYTFDNKEVTINDLGIVGSLVLLMKDALKPNLVQTLGGCPTLMHGGPFANIAHGCNSIIATRMGLKLGDIVVTEAGFGADLGAEKFLDIKCREASLQPNCVVVVATIRALKMHGGMDKENLAEENVEALNKGYANLQKHIENVQQFSVPYVVAINKFPTDTKAEVEELFRLCKEHGHEVYICDVYGKGGDGALEIAEAVSRKVNEPSKLTYTYDLTSPIKEKIEAIATKIYGANNVEYSEQAELKIAELQNSKYKDAYICMAKTPNSLTDDATIVGRPTNFTIHVKEVRLSAGANFIVVLTGAIMTMPGLPKVPAATKIDILEDGTIKGLF